MNYRYKMEQLRVRKFHPKQKPNYPVAIILMFVTVIFMLYLFGTNGDWPRTRVGKKGTTKERNPWIRPTLAVPITCPQLTTREIEKTLGMESLPYIYAITPTYTRPVQKAELVRLRLSFLNVENFHWILVEDSEEKTTLVAKFLNASGVSFTHLNVRTQGNARLKSHQHRFTHPRGVDQRNVAIDWLHHCAVEPAVVYFADDDNTYSPEVFSEMRFTQNVSVWPVGLVGGLRFEGPIVSPTTGRVTGWHAAYLRDRAFAVDMAGFAINMDLFRDYPDVRFNIRKAGLLEDTLLRDLNVTLNDLEPMADNCTQVYVWHTRTEKPALHWEDKLMKKGQPSDPNIEV